MLPAGALPEYSRIWCAENFCDFCMDVYSVPQLSLLREHTQSLDFGVVASFCAPAPDEPDLVCPCVTIPRKLAQTDPHWATFRIHGEPLCGYKLRDNPKASLSRKHSDHKILILRAKPCARSKKALNYPKPQPQPPSPSKKKNILNTPTPLASRKPDYLLQGQLQANEQMTELISASCPRI